MKNWNDLKAGEKVNWLVKECGRIIGYYDGVVSAVYSDHIIVTADGMKLWCDNSNCNDFCVGGGSWYGIKKLG